MMNVSPQRQHASIVHFITLARRGRFAGSSSGEKAAHRLAWSIINDTPGLDGSAFRGLEAFLTLANGNNQSAFHLLNDSCLPPNHMPDEDHFSRSAKPTRSPK